MPSFSPTEEINDKLLIGYFVILSKFKMALQLHHPEYSNLVHRINVEALLYAQSSWVILHVVK
jgi:hypothetical protein